MKKCMIFFWFLSILMWVSHDFGWFFASRIRIQEAKMIRMRIHITGGNPSLVVLLCRARALFSATKHNQDFLNSVEDSGSRTFWAPGSFKSKTSKKIIRKSYQNLRFFFHVQAGSGILETGSGGKLSGSAKLFLKLEHLIRLLYSVAYPDNVTQDFASGFQNSGFLIFLFL